MSAPPRPSLPDACYRGLEEVVRERLDAGEDPNRAAEPSGRVWLSAAGALPRPLNCVAIAWALTDAHVRTARLLLERGAVPDGTVLADHLVESVGLPADVAFHELVTATLATQR